MKPRRIRVEKVLDTVHKGIVWGCLGLTFYGFYLAGLRVHRYYTVIKPLGEERQRQLELELLSEGKSELFLPERPLVDDKN